VGADDVAVTALGRGADDRPPFGGGGCAPSQRQRAIATRMRCQANVPGSGFLAGRRAWDGCINCHGPNGLGGVPNPQSPDKTIPPLSGQDFRHEFNTDRKILDVIRSGSVIGKQPIASMPHWGGIIPAWQLNALVAYLKTLK